MLIAAEMARVVEKMTGEAAILELELHEANEAKQQLLNEVTEVRIEGAERAADIEGAEWAGEHCRMNPILLIFCKRV